MGHTPPSPIFEFIVQSLPYSILSYLFSGVLVSLDDYTITCDCGVITEWSFYAKRGGTTHFFVSRSGTIVGSTKVFVQQIAPAGRPTSTRM